MKSYLVGGAVRDILLGLEPKDRDYVVVGETHESMVRAGFMQVGNDFPVYLHPKTKEEYALARTERRTGKGHTAFEVQTKGVTLEEDLRRRDLTINAMAMDADGNIVDPFGGQVDLKNNVLRHVADDTFVEDPLRLLRVARFRARMMFSIQVGTRHLLDKMVASGDLNHLTPERVMMETIKALKEEHPEEYFMTLLSCGALQVIMPELACLSGVPQPAEHHPEIDTFVHVMMALQQCATMTFNPVTRFAVLVHDLGKGITPKDELPHHFDHESLGVPLVDALCERLKFPNEYRRAGVDACRQHLRVHRILDARTPGKVVSLLTSLGVPQTIERVEHLVIAAEADARGRAGLEDRPYPQSAAFLELAHALSRFNTAEVAREAKERGKVGPQIGEAIMNARCHFMSREMKRVRNECRRSNAVE